MQLTVRQAAEILKVPEKTVYRWIDDVGTGVPTESRAVAVRAVVAPMAPSVAVPVTVTLVTVCVTVTG